MKRNKNKHTAQITKTNNLNYKNGFVQCACGWEKPLGNGFNGYHIARCPYCCPKLPVHVRNQVLTGTAGNYIVKHGSFYYFALSNGIYVQYKSNVMRSQHHQRLPRN